MAAPQTLTKIDRLRSRDGERCWLCNGKLDFLAAPNSSKAPTIEHLLAKANGGTNAIDNLVLTHPGCNKQLGARPVEEKLKMRAQYQAARERTRAVREVCATTPIEEGGRKQIERQLSEKPTSQMQALRNELKVWQAWTALAAGSALVAIGFATGTVITR